jgi:3,4-dehydroadipyl-CoA semialdehyde dehydrogenase
VLFDGGGDAFQPLDADIATGAFVPPTLLICNDAIGSTVVHDVEVFGPVATLLTYDDLPQAFTIARLGQGSLVASVFSGDPEVLETAAVQLADSHGRIVAVTAAVGQSHTGHGNVMPMSLHGGPGRAGGGEELGGLRALAFYHRRSAIQGPEEQLRALAERGVELRH